MNQMPRVDYSQNSPLVISNKLCTGKLCEKDGDRTPIPWRDDFCPRCYKAETLGDLDSLFTRRKVRKVTAEQLGDKAPKFAGIVQATPSGRVLPTFSEQRTRSEPTLPKRYIGHKFGQWTVLGLHWADGRVRAECRCGCGTERTVTLDSLKNGASKSCGCAAAKGRSINPIPVGETFGRLTVIRSPSPGKWLCSCSCGSEPRTYHARNIKCGSTKSCGCLAAEVNRSKIQSVNELIRGRSAAAEAARKAARAALQIGSKVWIKGELQTITKISKSGDTLYTDNNHISGLKRDRARPESWGPSLRESPRTAKKADK